MIRPLTDYEFLTLVRFVRERYGINLEKKRTLIEARLDYELERSGFSGYAEYLRAVTAEPDGEECRRMINRLSTNYTYFFREPEAFAYLSRHILPAHTLRPLSLWCAACSSGEEAYSLSMVLTRASAATGQSFRLLATDINTEILQTAEKGVYPASVLTSIPPEYRRYTLPEGKNIRICSQVAAPICWKRVNLLNFSLPERMDVIFCRNVLIYFTPEERERLALRLYQTLKPGGYLFLSCVESIDLERKLFLHVEPSVYQKRKDAPAG